MIQMGEKSVYFSVYFSYSLYIIVIAVETSIWHV